MPFDKIGITRKCSITLKEEDWDKVEYLMDKNGWSLSQTLRALISDTLLFVRVSED